MKKIIFPTLFIMALFPSCIKKLAQSSLADPNDDQVMLKKHFDKDLMDQVKATTTVFFYKKDSQGQIDSLKQAVSSGWDLTPLIFDEIGNFDKYASDPKYSYFDIEGLTTTTTMQSGGSYSNTYYYLCLRLFKKIGKKNKVLTTGLYRIELYPNFHTIGTGAYGNKASEVINKLYDHGVFYNWNPILLKAQVQNVSTNLKKSMRPWNFQNIKDDNLSDLLSADTLYVPQSLLMSFKAMSGKEKSKDENFFASYRNKYRVCTDAELFDIFETQKRGRLLFEYVKSSTDKFVTVYDLKDKKIVYKKYTPVSYNLKAKDIEKIK